MMINGGDALCAIAVAVAVAVNRDPSGMLCRISSQGAK
jgi:hypothetical protein